MTNSTNWCWTPSKSSSEPGRRNSPRVEFAVEDVPPAATTDTDIEFNPEVVADGPVPLGRLYRGGVESIESPVIVIYRRPVEARTADKSERADLVFAVVAELVAELLGRDLDEIDPP